MALKFPPIMPVGPQDGRYRARKLGPVYAIMDCLRRDLVRDRKGQSAHYSSEADALRERQRLEDKRVQDPFEINNPAPKSFADPVATKVAGFTAHADCKAPAACQKKGQCNYTSCPAYVTKAAPVAAKPTAPAPVEAAPKPVQEPKAPVPATTTETTAMQTQTATGTAKRAAPPKATKKSTKPVKAAAAKEPKKAKATKAAKAPAKKAAAKKAATPKAVKAVTKSAVGTRLIADEAKITVVAKENPYREGTKAYDTFKLFKTGMTVGEFRKKAGKAGPDTKYNPGYVGFASRDGHIKIS